MAVLYLADVIFALESAKRLQMVVWVLIRRLGILFALGLEFAFLRILPSRQTLASLALIVCGTGVALADSPSSFDAPGYLYLVAYNLCDALNAVLIKRNLSSAESLGRTGVLYYSAALDVLPVLLLTSLTDDKESALHFPGWTSWPFLCAFVSANLFSLLMLYTWVLCNEFNSPLMVQVTATIRNALVSYAGIMSEAAYMLQVTRFIAINVSILGGFAYSYFAFRGEQN